LNHTEIFLKKKPKPVQTDRFRFGFLGQQPVQTGLDRFWVGFFGLAWFFYLEPIGFFLILIGFFSLFGFFGFLDFFAHPY
jgi:hypothetical protein